MAILYETVDIFGGWKRVPEGFPGWGGDGFSRH